jgi:CBS domain containing-hemolysin-like protein
MSSGIMLLIAGLLVLLNGFFVAAEFALVKVRATRIEELAKGGRAVANVVRRQLRHLDEYLAACQFGITVASLGLGWAGEGAVEHLIRPLLNPLGLPETVRVLNWNLNPLAVIGALIAFSVITSLHITLGEQVPKMIAIQQAERAVMICAYPLGFFYRIFRLPVGLLNGASTLTARLLGFRATGHQAESHSEEELLMILDSQLKRGERRESELNLVEHVFVFADKRAREIMTPRVDMVYLSTEWSFGRNLELAASHSFTRFPLCAGDPDRVIGLIHFRDLLREAQKPDPNLEAIRRDIIVVPETKPIDHLLREFQVRKLHMAVVLDEYGGTAGIVTLEDVLEQIVGDITDEFEEPAPEVRQVNNHEYLVDGKALVTDLRNEFDLEIPANGDNSADTIGGWILDHAGTIPEPGTVIDAGPYRIEVKEMAGHRIRKVLITAPEPPPAGDVDRQDVAQNDGAGAAH